MFRNEYKKIYSEKVPEKLLEETIAVANEYENQHYVNKSHRSVFIHLGAGIAAAVIIFAIFVIPIGNNRKDNIPIVDEEKSTDAKGSNGFYLTAAAAEADEYSDVDSGMTLWTGESSYGWLNSGDYSNDNNDFVINYNLNFKICGTNISSVTLDAEDFILSLLPIGEEQPKNIKHTYKIDNSPNGKLQDIKISDLYYSYISDRNNKIIDELISNIYNTQKELKQLTYEKHQKYGDYYTTDSQEDKLDKQCSRYIDDLLEYVYHNAEIKVTVTYENGLVETQTIYVDFVLSQAYMVPFNHNENIFDAQYGEYSLVTDAEKDISYGWLVFKYYSDNGISANSSKKIIAAAEKHTDIYGGYYFDDNKRLNILVTDNYVEGTDEELDTLLKSAEIKRCKYTKSELVSILEKAVKNKNKCYDYGDEYFNLNLLIDYKNNRLICQINDFELSDDEVENLKSNIRANVIYGVEDYFIFENMDKV